MNDFLYPIGYWDGSGSGHGYSAAQIERAFEDTLESEELAKLLYTFLVKERERDLNGAIRDLFDTFLEKGNS